ncbi:MAG TPA: TonB-dependent receptor [Candidatus Polarisedimenticolaceae bacterium]
MRRPALAFALCVCAVHAASPDPWTLVDADGRPAAGFRVQVVGRTGSAVTGADGAFAIEPGPVPPFQLAVFDPRGTLAGVIGVNDLASRTLTVPAGVTAEVIVRGGVAPSTPSAPAAAATLFAGETRERTRPARLADVLTEIPGASRLEEGASVVPALRGLARGRTLILIDDARVTAERRAGPSATFLDPAVLESVEVVRGPGSVGYGSDALGGVIHVRTPLPRPGDFAARFETTAATGLPYAAGAVELNVPAGDGAVLAQVRARSYQDYDSPDGKVPNSSARDRGALVRWLTPVGDKRLWFALQVDRARDIGKPATDSSVTRAFYPTEDSDRFTVGLDAGRFAGFETVEVRGFAGRYRLVTDRDRAQTAAVTRRIQRADVDANDASFRATGTRPFERGFLRAGVDFSSRFGLNSEETTFSFDASGAPTSTTTTTSVERASRYDLGLHVEAEVAPADSRFTLAGGARLDGIAVRNEGGYAGDVSDERGVLSGYASASARVAATSSVTLQLARGFRDPTLSDRFFRGPSGRGFITGNPDLKPESTLQADLVFRTKAGRANLAAYAYAYRIDDLIERYGEPDPTDPTVTNFYYRNRARADLRGLELEAELPLAAGFRLRGAASWAEGEIVDDGTPAADIPPVSFVATVEQDLDRVWWRARGRVQLRKDDPGPVEVVTPGYATFDAAVGVRLGAGLEARLGVDNLLDKSYPATADPTAVAAPGRAASLTLTGRF